MITRRPLQILAFLSVMLLSASGGARAQDLTDAELQAVFGPADDDAASDASTEGAGDEGWSDVSDLDEVDLEQLLEGVVVTATRTRQRVEDAPAIVTVITRREMEMWGYQSVAEVLRHALGFYVIDDHAIPNVAVRGVSAGLRGESGLIKVMIDGRSVAFRSTAGNWLGPELIPLTAVERIEIVRGPASAIYGADAFLGVINVITRRGNDVLGGQIAVNGQNTGAWGGGGDALIGARNGRLEATLAGGLTERRLTGLSIPATSPAPVIAPYHRGPLMTDGLLQRSGVALANIGYHLTDDSVLTFTAYASTLDRGAELADWTQLANGVDGLGRSRENRISLRQGMMALRLDSAISNRANLSLDYVLFAGEPGPSDRIDVGSDIFYVRRELSYRGYSLSASGTFQPSDAWTLVTGLDFTYDDEQLPSVLHVLMADSPPLLAGDVREATSTRQGRELFLNPGAYLHGVYVAIPDALSLTAGLRYDYHNIYGSQFNGRVGGILSPLDDLHIKLLYGNAFRAPSPLLLHGVPVAAGDILGNQDLEPQHIHTFEAHATYSATEELTLQTGVAYSYLLNKAEFALVGVNKVARNLAEVGALSWETGADLTLNSTLRAYARASLQHLVRDEGEAGYRAELLGSDMLAYPWLITHAGLLYRIPHLPLRAGAEVSYFSAVRSSDTNGLENGAVYDIDPAFELGATLATVGFELLPSHETDVRLVARNLLNATNATPGFAGIDYPSAGRSVMIYASQEL